VDRFIYWIAQVVLCEHGIPAKVESSTQVETGSDIDSIIAGKVRSHELSFSSLRIITFSSQAQHITEGLVTEASHELNCIVTSIVNVSI
jgi:hypothetical protein